MKSGRLLFQSMLIAAIICLLTEAAFAGFGFGGNDTGKSGLDFSLGYDINTVTTMTGRVTSLPGTSAESAVIIEAKSGSETFQLYVGPGSYWDKNGIQLHVNDEITAKGSRAQGKDGRIYLLTQKLVNRTTGAQIELRTATGQPGWLSADKNLERPSGGQRPAGGTMMHGGGMMHNGGAGMMRR